jgi:hypothetical protein
VLARFVAALCLDDSGPSADKQQQLSFCSSIKDPANTKGACCDAGREQSIKATLYDAVLAGKTVSDNCKNLLAQIACGECNPYAQHLFDRGLDKPTLCPDFCRYNTRFNSAYCSDMIHDCHLVSVLPEEFCNACGSRSIVQLSRGCQCLV